MTALAAIPLGIDVRFLVPSPAPPVAAFGGVMVGDWTDPDVLRAFAEGCDAVTVESEWAPAEQLAAAMPEGFPVWPAPNTLATIRDKARQKEALAEAGLPLPAYALATSAEHVADLAAGFGYPALLKRRRGSYDGYGNATVRGEGEVAAAFEKLVEGEAEEDAVLVEAFVPFRRELAVMVARSSGGETAVYPVVYTEQRDHRCHAVVAPSGLEPEAEAAARALAVRAVEAVGGVGVTGVELFELEDGRFLVNELAPRPHNTGHYTIEACRCSQFENHARAVLGWPLGDPALRFPSAAMINVIGRTDAPVGSPAATGVLDAAAIPGAHVHLYGKAASRPKRKMGHVTAVADSPEAARELAERAATLIRL
jgi:5-(carboxyamino)imidazole ribonucleotide synthase